MTRKEQIEALEYIDSHINHYMNQLLCDEPDYMISFWTPATWQHKNEIAQKCLDYWKIRNNKILAELMY